MNRIKIGLALGSGAARGWAHIGVIRALQDMGIEPDVITGTSIGSLVGGAYAAGKLDEIEEWVRDMDRWKVFNLLDFGLSSGGVISGEKVFNHAQERFGDILVENLDKPFAAVATDLYTGREVWLKEGNLFKVARASCAMPGLLAPKMFDGRWLVDGALVNPVPVSLARALEADFVIAVNLNSQIHIDDELEQANEQAPNTKSEQPAKDVERKEGKATEKDKNLFHNFLSRSQSYIDQIKEKFSRQPSSPGVFGVMAGSIDIMQERITKARMAGDPPDVLLQPKVGDIGLLEFELGKHAIDIGYKTTMAMKEQILEELHHLNMRIDEAPRPKS
ncbi:MULTISPECIES: patatin-like phospholipase RssA [Gammaproteobacteria]|uniref:patatin-like phospholipase RssA n=1 Tax=Gammaproteobacteria TaxID=1236 RepID=UPI000DD077B2|nr:MULTISPECIES: patatin-like phospholipase RssA [Gammaproteobacteria]RTE87130.1 patatin-like phospholipase RssA [Aliidiomarina sp. B3213]TCZ93082.1 patatin-like phospholipase RssA [Lysobacter sp. N42]